MKNKIGWCSMTFNPCWGCLNHCEYCYARGIAKRFAKPVAEKEIAHLYGLCIDEKTSLDLCEKLKNDIKEFKPTFMYCQFDKKLPKKPQRIFVGSMSEIYHWEWGWVEMVIEKIKKYPQHTFMFLTQHPEVYAQHLFPSNCWYGITLTNNKPIRRVSCVPTEVGIKYLSIEPILERIDIEIIDDFEPNWIIVGAESGNRKGKVIPKKEWIEVVIDFCNRCNVPIYIKDNLVKYLPEYKGLKEFPGVK